MIKFILILCAIFIVVYFLSDKSTNKIRAYKKLGLIFFSVVVIVAVLYPSYLNTIATSLGVGRGADLLLYMFFMAFIFYVLNTYLNGQKKQDEIYRLARKISIIEAYESKRNTKIIAKIK